MNGLSIGRRRIRGRGFGLNAVLLLCSFLPMFGCRGWCVGRGSSGRRRWSVVAMIKHLSGRKLIVAGRQYR
jgi:hypothetical protein